MAVTHGGLSEAPSGDSYLLLQRLNEPLVPHEVAGHVNVPVIDQDPVVLQKERNTLKNPHPPVCGQTDY